LAQRHVDTSLLLVEDDPQRNGCHPSADQKIADLTCGDGDRYEAGRDRA
jgi:hypothetical protein